MPAKDIYHDTVKNALIKEGWTITDDPLILKWGSKTLLIDLGAEKLIAAEKDNEKIAVEIKSFIGASQVNDLEKALGQYILYNDILAALSSDKVLYLAITHKAFTEIFQEPIGNILLQNQRVRLIVFEAQKEEILQWIP